MSACGTYLGWSHHRDARETPCQPCKDAQAKYHTDWRLRTGRTKTVRVPVAVLADAFAAEDPLLVLRTFLGRDVADAIENLPKASGEAA